MVYKSVVLISPLEIIRKKEQIWNSLNHLPRSTLDQQVAEGEVGVMQVHQCLHLALRVLPDLLVQVVKVMKIIIVADSLTIIVVIMVEVIIMAEMEVIVIIMREAVPEHLDNRSFVRL